MCILTLKHWPLPVSKWYGHSCTLGDSMVLPIRTAQRLQAPALYTTYVCDGSEVPFLRAGKTSLESFHRAGVNRRAGEGVYEAGRTVWKERPFRLQLGAEEEMTEASLGIPHFSFYTNGVKEPALLEWL